MTQTLIEKLEALPRYDYESRGYMGFNVWQALPDGKGEYIRSSDIRAIIEQHKSEAPLQETIHAQQAEIERLKEYEDSVYAHFDVACHSYDASKSVYDNLSMLQSWHCEIALDPKVSKPANDLHSEIDRMKGQRDRLIEIVNSLSEVDICYSQHHGKKDRHSNVYDCPVVKRVKSLIAEIEAEK